MIYWLSDAPPGSAIGPKAAVLAHLTQAGFPVPPGFCVTARGNVKAAFDRLNAPLVAVRSSALSEDGKSHSYAGQHLTLLNIDGNTLESAIEKVAQSAAGALAYRTRFGLSDSPAMPVLVQAMLTPTHAGVLFTCSPTDDDEMLLEAVTGLGDSLVSGMVTPDQYRYRNATWSHTRGPHTTTLSDAMLAQLVGLATRLVSLLGQPQDIEWAEVDGTVWLLQARPITATALNVRRTEINHARTLAHPNGTAWSRYSLAESLPAPRPMTWSLIQQLMSGRGAYGSMYRDLGYDPDPSLDQDGVLDLIAGRAWYNLSREPRMYFRGFPYRHSLEHLKTDARHGSYPVPEVALDGLPTGFWRQLPRTIVTMVAAAGRLARSRRSFLATFESATLPAWRHRIDTITLMSLDTATAPELAETLRTWLMEVDAFAREAFKASAFAVLATDSLKRSLQPGDPSLATCLADAVEGDIAGALRLTATGQMSWDTLLRTCGHRGPVEMELAEPRWKDNPSALKSALDSYVLKQTTPVTLPARLRHCVDEARQWIGLRETARHWLMAGWMHVRHVLLALGRRCGVGDGIFDLYENEINALVGGTKLANLIQSRRQHRQACLALEVPTVLFSDDLEAIGRAPIPAHATVLQGQGVSAGVASGPAVIRYEANEPVTEADFILVCPSTDPGWTPLMLRARALVMETGGMLSHGAIIAREARIPAVVGIPGVLRRIRHGVTVHVDGDSGTVRLS